MVPTAKKYLDIVRQILLERLSPYDAKIILFGSMARGDYWRASDIDVAVLPGKKIPAGLLSELREEFEESQIPYHIELIHLTIVLKSFADRVLETGLPWSD